ncbi:hypothetical protein [Salinicola aestuarinus]|uniref:hypothetical protein n=1 Tax=Salinicola aestuarinus TaxID=1949082 RepID=UPI000DA23167|nr:hypothetical protein [Salinicola aestuarinus]
MNRVRLFLLVSMLLVAVPAGADILVVVNPDSGIRTLSRSDAINIFMGRYRKLPNGGLALPVDLVSLKPRFYRALVDKNLAAINSYWARLVFSGEASPPQQSQSAADVHHLLAHNPNVLGYVDSETAWDDLRVVLTLDE